MRALKHRPGFGVFLLALLLAPLAHAGGYSASAPGSETERRCAIEVPRTSACTRDINRCGHPSQCRCPAGYTYNAAVYKCLLDLSGSRGASAAPVRVADNDCVRPAEGVCTRDINPCGHPSMCSCDEGFVWNPAAGKCLRDVSRR